MIQAGAILAVTLIYRRRLADLATGWRDPGSRDYLAKLLTAFVITAVLGVVVKKAGFQLPETVTPIAWALVIGGVWYAIQHSFRRGQTAEELLLNRRTAQVIRRDPGGGLREWTTNSYWLRPILRRGPVESYLTLTDGKREIELGAFLTPQERRHLHDDLLRRLANLR